jgi:hypothetical protein
MALEGVWVVVGGQNKSGQALNMWSMFYIRFERAFLDRMSSAPLLDFAKAGALAHSLN